METTLDLRGHGKKDARKDLRNLAYLTFEQKLPVTYCANLMGVRPETVRRWKRRWREEKAAAAKLSSAPVVKAAEVLYPNDGEIFSALDKGRECGDVAKDLDLPLRAVVQAYHRWFKQKIL